MHRTFHFFKQSKFLIIRRSDRHLRGHVTQTAASSREMLAWLRHPEGKFCVKLFFHSPHKTTTYLNQKASIDTYVGCFFEGTLPQYFHMLTSGVCDVTRILSNDVDVYLKTLTNRKYARGGSRQKPPTCCCHRHPQEGRVGSCFFQGCDAHILAGAVKSQRLVVF